MLPVPPTQLASVPTGLAAPAAGALIVTGAAGLRHRLISRATTLCAPTDTFGKLPLAWKVPPSSEDSYAPVPPVAVTVMLPVPPKQLASVPTGLAATAAGALIVTGAAGLRHRL